MNMGLLTGEIGSGKTLTQTVFAERLDPERFEVLVQENSNFGFKDLLGGVLAALEQTAPRLHETTYMRCQHFRRAIEQLHARGRHLVLIFDEAQEMSDRTLSDLKLLTNYNGHGQALLTLILVGQPELRQRVARLPAINQRISLRFHLHRLTAMESTAAYLRHRLRTAGHPNGDVFLPEAIHRAFEASAGIPRELNRLAKLSLELAWLRDLPQIPAPVVDGVVRDLERQQTLCAA